MFQPKKSATIDIWQSSKYNSGFKTFFDVDKRGSRTASYIYIYIYIYMFIYIYVYIYNITKAFKYIIPFFSCDISQSLFEILT